MYRNIGIKAFLFFRYFGIPYTVVPVWLYTLISDFFNSCIAIYYNSGIRNTVLPEIRNSDYRFTVFLYTVHTVHTGIPAFFEGTYGIPVYWNHGIQPVPNIHYLLIWHADVQDSGKVPAWGMGVAGDQCPDAAGHHRHT